VPRFNFPPQLHRGQALAQRVNMFGSGIANVGFRGQRLAVSLELKNPCPGGGEQRPDQCLPIVAAVEQRE